jgi:DNA modification methylase
MNDGRSWPADKVERRHINSIVPYARNSRTHSDEQVAQIAASIKEWGFTNPILIDVDGEIIAGHGRLMAAQKLGLTEVPCITAVGWTDAQKKAYVIADNKLALNAGWDDEMLAVEFGELKELDFDISLTGFNADELANLLKEPEKDGLTDEDDVPEAPEVPVTVEGDVWILGRHKIVCGDATDVNCWEKLQIENGVAVFSSPPYNLGSSIKLSGNKNLNKKSSAYETYSDNASDAEYLELLQSSLNASLSFCDVAAFNLQPLANSKRALMKFMNDNSSNMVDIITWDKGHAAPIIAEGVMSSRYEWIFLFSNKDEASRSIPYASWRGKWSNVYQAPSQKDNKFSEIHGATFPVHLPMFVVGDLMNRSRGVVDCFCGTGTTIIAAEKLGKIGYGIELDPKYCDVIIKRWQDYTGEQATLETTGQTYDELKSERVAA